VLWALWVLLLLCLLPVLAFAGVEVSAVRVWPAPEYTRITLESARPIEFTLFTVKDPHRLVLDLEDVEPGAALESLPARLGVDDAFIAQARIGRFKPGVLRVVLEVRGDVRPQAFALRPVGDYGHRLVLDVYPAEPVDPLLALLEQLERRSPRRRRPTRRPAGRWWPRASPRPGSPQPRAPASRASSNRGLLAPRHASATTRRWCGC
jgi:N-acetylmuramoyl-L-alanine amidase